VKLLLANKETDISARTSDKYLTYLHIACSRGNIDILKHLMKTGKTKEIPKVLKIILALLIYKVGQNLPYGIWLTKDYLKD
jgi:hypothetical protein